MPRGGARMNSGPPPDPNALRRDRREDKDGWTTLPAEGRAGSVPVWPLVSTDDDGRRDVLWADLWRKPQAVMWERQSVGHDVAMYVVCLMQAERGDLKAAAEERQRAASLGLSSAGMLRNRWRVAADQVAAKRTEKVPAAAVGASVRDRLRAVNGGA